MPSALHTTMHKELRREQNIAFTIALLLDLPDRVGEDIFYLKHYLGSYWRDFPSHENCQKVLTLSQRSIKET